MAARARKRKEKAHASMEGVELALCDFATGEILWMSGNLTGRRAGDASGPALLKVLEG